MKLTNNCRFIKRLEYSATRKSGIKIVQGNFGNAGEVYWSSCMIKILAFKHKRQLEVSKNLKRK